MAFGFGTANFLAQNLPIAEQQRLQYYNQMGGVPGVGGISPLIDDGTSTGQVFRTIGPVGGQISTPIDAQGNPIGAAPVLSYDDGVGSGQTYRWVGGVGSEVLTPIDAEGNPIGTPVGPGYIPPQTSIPGGSSANIIGGLPPLRGTAGGESRIDPSLRPYLELGLRRGEQLFFGEQQPQLYPGQMFVSPSQQTQQALAAQEALARQQSPFIQEAGQSYMSAMGGLGQIAGGSFLGGSPFLERSIQAATRPVMQQFEQSTLPAIQSAFSRAGRYGSGAQERAIGQATEATSRAIGDISSQLAAADFARERQLMQQALGQQLGAAQLAPQFFGAQFLPSQQLAQIGAAQEQIAAQPLQEAMTRFQFAQQLPYQQLQGFLSGVYGTPMAQSQYASVPQTTVNRSAQNIGALTSLASLVPESQRNRAIDYVTGLLF